MNTIDKLTKLGLLALSDAAAAAALAPLTARDLDVTEVRVLLRERGLWLKDPISRARSLGTIGAAMTQAGFPPALYAALSELEAALYDQSATQISTATSAEIAGKVAATIAGLLAVGAMTAADAAAFWELGDGQPFAGIAEADIAADRAAAVDFTDRDAARLAIHTRAKAAMEAADTEFRAGGSTVQTITAAGEGAF